LSAAASRGAASLALWLALCAFSAISCGGTARDGHRRSDGATLAQERAPTDDPPPGRPSKVYYVSRKGNDAHDGSSKRPWRTIAHAAARAGPGSLVRVRPGHYPGPIVLRRSGRPGRRITFAATTRWRARISATSSGSLAVVQMDGDYVDVEGFDIRGRGGDGTAGIAMQGSYQRALGNDVHNVVIACNGGLNGGAGIVAGSGNPNYGNHDLEVAGNLVHDVVGVPTRRCNGVQGIYAAVPRVRVVNNIAYRNGHDCITSWHAASQLTIVNNTVADCPAAGITVGSGDTGATPRGNHDSFVANNLVLRNRQGIVETTDGRHPVGRGNHYVNNLIFASGALDAFRPGNSLSRQASVSGTLGADPRLLPGDHYRLTVGSPAIDAGTNLRAPSSDFDDVARPQGRGVDIGAYEWRSTAPARSVPAATSGPG
jgi:pectate disaccharide-lyase